jgi:carbon-monoxide dehydrogenase medium subunit
MWQEYLFPQTIEEALTMLEDSGGRARIIAGGTDLVIETQRGKCLSEVMVDVTRIPALDFLEERDGWIHIGPQVTHGQVAASPLVRERAGLLAEACGKVGGPQLRRIATLVGNVVNAMPAADGAVALFALGAELEVTDRLGGRWVPIAELYEGVGACRMNPCYQFITAIRFPPLPQDAGWAFMRLVQRKANVLPILNSAIVIRLKNDRFTQARIFVSPVAQIPLRASQAEEILVGASADDETIAQSARLAQEAANPRDSAIRGSNVYRKAMVEVLVRRGLQEAVAMAQGR